MVFIQQQQQSPTRTYVHSTVYSHSYYTGGIRCCVCVCIIQRTNEVQPYQQIDYIYSYIKFSTRKTGVDICVRCVCARNSSFSVDLKAGYATPRRPAD